MKGFGLFVILFWIMYGYSWCVNVYQLTQCDFDAPYKGEVIHAVGVVVPMASLVTAWNEEK